MLNKEAYFKISYGLYIISSFKDGKINGQIANSLFQVTSDPSTIAVSINRQNYTHEFICASKVFTVSVLSEAAPLTFIAQFGFKSGKDINKFEGVAYKLGGETNAPIILDHSVANFELKVIDEIDRGSHTIFIGNILSCEKLSDDSPMTYDYYHMVKGGKSPKTAPTFMKEDPRPPEKKNFKYVCDICGYVYDPQLGDPRERRKTFDTVRRNPRELDLS